MVLCAGLLGFPDMLTRPTARADSVMLSHCVSARNGHQQPVHAHGEKADQWPFPIEGMTLNRAQMQEHLRGRRVAASAADSSMFGLADAALQFGYQTWPQPHIAAAQTTAAAEPLSGGRDPSPPVPTPPACQQVPMDGVDAA